MDTRRERKRHSLKHGYSWRHTNPIEDTAMDTDRGMDTEPDTGGDTETDSDIYTGTHFFLNIDI